MSEVLAETTDGAAGAESLSSFVAYVSRFDGQFPQRIRGAAEGDIARLEQLIRQPLPDQYRDFLRYMGNSSDRLIFAGECQTNITYVTKYHQRRADNGPNPDIPEGYLVIGAPCISSDEMCLDCRSAGTPSVVVMEDEAAPSFYAKSLIGLLYCRAFTTYRLPCLPHFKFFTQNKTARERQDSFERVEEWVAARSWSRQWFSDSHSLCVEGAGVAFCLTHYNDDTCTLHIGGDYEDDLTATARELSRAMRVELMESSLD